MPKKNTDNREIGSNHSRYPRITAINGINAKVQRMTSQTKNAQNSIKSNEQCFTNRSTSNKWKLADNQSAALILVLLNMDFIRLAAANKSLLSSRAEYPELYNPVGAIPCYRRRLDPNVSITMRPSLMHENYCFAYCLIASHGRSTPLCAPTMYSIASSTLRLTHPVPP